MSLYRAFIYIYCYHIFCPPCSFSKKNVIYWPFCLRNPFIQLVFKTMVLTVHKGNSVSLTSRHNIKHMLAWHLFLSNWLWNVVWLMTRAIGWGTCRATVELDKREVPFADSFNHGKYLTQYIWWPHSLIWSD